MVLSYIIPSFNFQPIYELATTNWKKDAMRKKAELMRRVLLNWRLWLSLSRLKPYIIHIEK